MSGIKIVISTIGNQDQAKEIAEALVREQLAACVNILPELTSIYRWKGAIQTEPEALMILKTSTDRVAELISRLVELHPYELPEVVSIPVESAHQPYLNWVLKETGETGIPIT